MTALYQQRRGVPADIRLSSYRGVPHSVHEMIKMAKRGQADDQVRQHAERVVRRVTPKDYLSELVALYYDACRRFRYTRDPANTEYIMHPRVALQRRAMDCDDFAVYLRAVFATRAASVGVPVEFVTVGFAQPGRHTHVLARFYDTRSGRWLVADPVAGPQTATMIKRVTSHRAFPL